jgi:putative peptidoglycan lipid II flippase
VSLTKSVATLGGLTLISRVLGFIRDLLAADMLGAGPIAEAALVAFRLPNLFRRLFAEGAFSVAFVPLFSKKLEAGGIDEAAIFAEEAQVIMLSILFPLTILAVIFMPEIMPLLAWGFKPGTERFDLAVTLSRITFPYLILISVSALQGGVLNALDKYWAFATAPILFNLCLILGFAFTRFMPTAGHALAWGEALAGVAQLLWMMRACRKAGLHLRLRRPRLSQMVKRLFIVMGPAAVGAGAAQINILIDQQIASILPTGAIPYLYYADRLNQLPLGVIGVAIGTALLPSLSRHAKAGELLKLRETKAQAVEISLLLALPAAVALMVAARPIMEALFVRGKFSAEDAGFAAQALAAYSVGIPAYVLAKVLSAGFFAQEDTRTPVNFALITVAANTVLALSLIHTLSFVGIALATGLTAWLNVFLLARRLNKHNLLHFEARLKFALPRLLGAALLMAAALAGIDYGFSGWWLGSIPERAIALAALVTGGLVVYGGVALATGVLKPSDLRALRRRA